MSPTWKESIASATAVRRTLHRQPELAWQERNTAATIREQLTRLDISWRECAGTGTVATVNPDSREPAIALRADIDALPITEQSGANWKSTSEGQMHACGHDGHAATLLAAGTWLKQYERQLPGPVVLLFQPAEEGGHGAREMIADGALDRVAAVYGWHNWPGLALGQLHCPDGIVMAGNGTFEIVLSAEGGHASQPETVGDTILAASAVVMALQHIVSRRLPPQTAAVVSVTSIDGVSAPTVIPERVTLAGSIRVPDRATRERINQLIIETSRSTASTYGVDADTVIHPRYEATINHPGPAQNVRNAWQRLYGTDAVAADYPSPAMASEDFGYYLEQVPGAYLLVGCDDGLPEHRAALHSPYYDFNDDLIPLVARLYVALADGPINESDAPRSIT